TERARRRPSPSIILISTSGHSEAPECCGGSTGLVRRSISSGPRSGTGSTSSATSISAGTGQRFSGTGRPTSSRSRGPTGSEDKRGFVVFECRSRTSVTRDYSGVADVLPRAAEALFETTFLAGATLDEETLRVLTTRRERPR